MPNTLRLHRVLRAEPEKVYRAFLDADAMAKWLPPNGFTGKVHHLEAKVGGTAGRRSGRPRDGPSRGYRDGPARHDPRSDGGNSARATGRTRPPASTLVGRMRTWPSEFTSRRPMIESVCSAKGFKAPIIC